MSETDLRQRLTAILAADAAGYSRLMAMDEHATVAALDAAREVFRRQIESGLGRVVDMAGDSVLALFETATGAVTTALAIQHELRSLIASVPDDQRMRFRIGIHLGDVIEKPDGTAYGDGINIASRLQSLAEPGGITVSESIRTAVKGKVSAGFEDQGEQSVKNVADPVRVYRISSGAEANPSPKNGAAGINLSLPDKPSIAVLAFTNMSGDPEQEYFADGVVDDIISALSRVRAFFVIARNSSFTYKGKAVDIKQVGRELGVRYVLEGSIRRAGDRLRIVGQLIEAENGRHVWADRFEGTVDDVFELQDRITESVVGAIEPNLMLAEIERARTKPTANLNAYELCLKAEQHRVGSQNRSQNDEALGYLHRAIALDPDYSYAKALCARGYVTRHVQRWASDDEVKLGIRLAEQALAEHRDDPNTLSEAGVALIVLAGRHEEALNALDKALSLNPNSSRTQTLAGWAHAWNGDGLIALEHFRRAMRLSPLDPRLGSILAGSAWAHAILGQWGEALSVGHKSLHEAPTFLPSHNAVIFALVMLDRMEQARDAARNLMKINPEISVGYFRSLEANRDKAWQSRIYDALHAAGIPE